MGRTPWTVADRAHRSRATADAIEAKRLQDGLTSSHVAAALGVSKTSYFNIRAGAAVRLQLSTCGRVARWLEVPPENVLRWEGYWDNFSPVGRVLAPAMLQAEMGLRDLSEASGTLAETIWNSLTGRSCPEEDILERWADTIPMDFALLRDARKEMYTPPPAPKLAEQIRMIRKKKGRAGLLQLGQRLQASLLEKTTEERRRANAAKGGAATQIYWERAGEEERGRWALTHLYPRPQGVFGICRGCKKLTFLPLGPANGRRVEYHAACRGTWVAYGKGARADPTELAYYYETTVLYLRAKLRATDPRHPYSSQTHWLKELAKQRGLSTHGVAAQVDRLLNLLPELSVCNGYLRPKVEALLTLRRA